MLQVAEYQGLPPVLTQSLRDLTAILLAYGVRLQVVTAAGRTVALRSSVPSPFQARIDDSLTPTEWQIAVMVAHGSTNSEIAALRSLSEKTIESHLTRIYRKLGLRSRSELAVSVTHAMLVEATTAAAASASCPPAGRARSPSPGDPAGRPTPARSARSPGRRAGATHSTARR
jgi:DNA-binding CsgD family transcriptional regulator